MELLEKITLYDILGYTLPGGITLYILKGYSFGESFSTFGIIIFIMMSFLIGVLISEIASFLTSRILETKKVKDDIWNNTGLDVNIISRAFINSGIAEQQNQISDTDAVWKHFINMYSDIQIDKEYSRVHNYASAGLLCKNMTAVSLICMIYFFIKQSKIQFFVSLLALLIFYFRWYKFEKKKRGYTMNWYVQKYAKKK